MALTLQDLMTTTDANANSPAPHIAASRAQQSRTQHDPFAEFFKNAANELNNGAVPVASSGTTTASQTNSSSANADTTYSKSSSDKSHAADDSKTDKTTASASKQGNAHHHHKAQKEPASPDSTTANVASVPNSPTDQANAPVNTDQAVADTSGPNATTATNMFQVTLLAAQVYGSGNAAADQIPTKQTKDTMNAAVATAAIPMTNAAAGASQLSPTDLTALLANQGQVTQPMPMATPATVTNAQTQSGPNIAILQIPTGTASKASTTPTGSQARAVDSHTLKGDAMAQTADNAPTQMDALQSEPANAPKGGDQAKVSSTDAAPAAMPSTLADSTATLAATALAITDKGSSTSDDTGGTTNASVISPTATSPVATGIATPQQVQTLYSQAASRSDSPSQVTIEQVAMRLTKAADDGLDHLTIHLKPAELGTIEVKLEIGNDGVSKTTITADRQDTLNLLQKDSHRLEQALENAGVKTDSSTLSFNLRGDGGNRQMQNFFQQQGGYQPSASSSPYSPRSFNDVSLPEAATIVGYLNTRAAMGGIDIRV